MIRPERPRALSRIQLRQERRDVGRQARTAEMKPCTPETPRCIVAASYAYDLPACCRAHTARLVHTVGDAMTAAGVRWWLDYGSVLGAVRNPLLGQPGGIIAHDKDADLGFLAEDWDKLLALVPEWSEKKGARKAARIGYALGFEWEHKLPRQALKRPGDRNFMAGDSIKVRLSATNHSNVDLFPWYDRPYLRPPDGNRYRYHFVAVDRYKGREFPESMLLPLGTMEFEGRPCPVPANPEAFCAHRYGRNWQKPLKRNNDGRVRP